MRKHRKKYFNPWYLVLILLIPILVLGVWLATLYSNRSWDGITRYTIISVGPPVHIKSYDPGSGQGIEIILPDNLEIDAISGRGKWRADVLSQAGSVKWATDSVADYLGITFNGYQPIENWWDKWIWAQLDKSIAWKKINLENSGLLEKHDTPDGVQIYRLSGGWETKAKEWFSDQAIAAESLGVIVVNSLSEPGLGSRAARIVESMGLKVRSLSVSDENLEKCIIRGGQNLADSHSVKKLLRVFGCHWEVNNDRDLTLILGSEYSKYLSGD